MTSLSETEELYPQSDPDVPRARRSDDEELPSVSTDTTTLPKPAHTRVMVVANQKGGVGKTTTAVNVAVGLAQGGLKVLVIDLDPQGNASTALGVPHAAGTRGTYEAIISGVSIADMIVGSPESERIGVLPATVDLAGAELQLVDMPGRERRLARTLQGFLTSTYVDYVIIDCPPSLGLLTVNAFVAAQEVLLPIQCEYYALEGVSQLMNSIALVQANLNPGLRITTVLLTMYDGRTRLSSQVADEVRSHFPNQTLTTVVPRSVRVSEAPSYGQSVLTYEPRSVGASTYRSAAAEIALRGVIGV
jgi:chromosome partitioning protein